MPGGNNTNSQVTMVPKLETFTCFSDLPPELRVKIWKLNLPGPRIFPVAFDVRGHNIRTSIKPPIILRVCQESRAEAQKEYPPAFTVSSVSSVIPFNFSTDTLLFENFGLPYPIKKTQRKHYFESYISLEDRVKVRSIAICNVFDVQGGDGIDFIMKIFPNLSRISFVGSIYGTFGAGYLDFSNTYMKMSWSADCVSKMNNDWKKKCSSQDKPELSFGTLVKVKDRTTVKRDCFALLPPQETRRSDRNSGKPRPSYEEVCEFA